MSVDIVKEIHGKTANLKKSLGIEENAVSEVKALLEYQTYEDRAMLNLLGVNSMNSQLEESKGRLIVLEKFEQATKFPVIHVSTIEELCMKYRLRFLPSARYTGAIPPDITTEIRQLEKNKNEANPKFTKFDQHQLKTEFYIMAPPKMFKLEERKKIERISYFKQFIQMLEEEPILFYREDDEHFVMIKKWGNDFTIFRRALGFAMKSAKNLFLTILTSLLVFSFLLSCIFTNSYVGNSHILTAIVGFVICSIVSVVAAGVVVAFTTNDQDFSEHNWNSSTK